MSDKVNDSDASTEVEEQIEKVADTASQMGHSVIVTNGETVLIETLHGDEIRLTTELHTGDYSVVSESRDDFDTFDEAFSAFVDELLI